MDVLWYDFRKNIHSLGYSDQILFTVASLQIIFIAFYLHGWFFILADWYGFMDKYAIRSGKHRLPSLEMQWTAVREASIDLFLIKPVVLYFIYPFVGNIFIIFDGVLPSMGEVFLQWLSMNLIFSTSLYFFHRAMHHKYLYQYIHKRHHTYHDTVGFTAQYAHPVEGMISAFHVIFGIMIVRPHFLVYCIFLATTMTEIIDSHAGYDVPWSWLYPWSDRYFWGSGARAHDYHHSHNLGIYGGGLTGLWDKLLGTDADFVKFESKRLKELKEHN